MEIMDADELEKKRDALARHSENAGMIDTPEPRDTAGDELENGPDVDPLDPNLSELMAEAGAENRVGDLGMQDENKMRLDDKEEE